MNIFKNLVVLGGIVISFKSIAEANPTGLGYAPNDQNSTKQSQNNYFQITYIQNLDTDYYAEPFQEDFIGHFDCYVNYNYNEICFASPDNSGGM